MAGLTLFFEMWCRTKQVWIPKTRTGRWRWFILNLKQPKNGMTNGQTDGETNIFKRCLDASKNSSEIWILHKIAFPKKKKKVRQNRVTNEISFKGHFFVLKPDLSTGKFYSWCSHCHKWFVYIVILFSPSIVNKQQQLNQSWILTCFSHSWIRKTN